eukprot:2431083-Pyramimonas_sp.AAC.1
MTPRDDTLTVVSETSAAPQQRNRFLTSRGIRNLDRVWKRQGEQTAALASVDSRGVTLGHGHH